MANYVYPPLKHPTDIRLITLLPRTEKAFSHSSPSWLSYSQTDSDDSFANGVYPARLKDFRKAGGNTDISIEITVAKLEDTYGYSALSYVWGKAAEDTPSYSKAKY